MLEELFDIAQRNLPKINFDLHIIRHERFQKEAIKVICTVNDFSASRIIRKTYENPFSISTAWFINERKVNPHYSTILENIYEAQVKGIGILVY